MNKTFCNLCDEPIDISLPEETETFLQYGVRLTARFEPLPRVPDFDICKACKIVLLKDLLLRLEGF